MNFNISNNSFDQVLSSSSGINGKRIARAKEGNVRYTVIDKESSKNKEFQSLSIKEIANLAKTSFGSLKESYETSKTREAQSNSNKYTDAAEQKLISIINLKDSYNIFITNYEKKTNNTSKLNIVGRIIQRSNLILLKSVRKDIILMTNDRLKNDITAKINAQVIEKELKKDEIPQDVKAMSDLYLTNEQKEAAAIAKAAVTFKKMYPVYQEIISSEKKYLEEMEKAVKHRENFKIRKFRKFF